MTGGLFPARRQWEWEAEASIRARWRGVENRSSWVQWAEASKSDTTVLQSKSPSRSLSRSQSAVPLIREPPHAGWRTVHPVSRPSQRSPVLSKSGSSGNIHIQLSHVPWYWMCAAGLWAETDLWGNVIGVIFCNKVMFCWKVYFNSF